MKLTKSQLKKIIKEELEAVLNEDPLAAMNRVSQDVIQKAAGVVANKVPAAKDPDLKDKLRMFVGKTPEEIAGMIPEGSMMEGDEDERIAMRQAARRENRMENEIASQNPQEAGQQVSQLFKDHMAAAVISGASAALVSAGLGIGLTVPLLAAMAINALLVTATHYGHGDKIGVGPGGGADKFSHSSSRY